MRRNILLAAFGKSVLVSLFIFSLLFLFYSLTDLSGSDSQIADGKIVLGDQTPVEYWSHFIRTGNLYSILYHRPVLTILATSFTVTFIFSLTSLFFAVLWSFLTVIYILKCNSFYIIKKIRELVLFLYGFPSSVFILLSIFIFAFVLNWFPSSYQTDLFSLKMLFPVFVLSLLFTFVLLFYTFSHMTLERIEEIQFQLRLHQFGFWTNIRFFISLEKELFRYLFLLFIPIIFKGSVFAEILFSIPGISRVLFEAMKTHDFPVVMTCFPFVAFIYSFFFFIIYSERPKGFSLV